MRRWLVNSANILFGVVPATFLFFWAVLLLFVGLVSLPAAPPGVSADITPVVAWKATFTLAVGTAAVAGYVALLFAVKGVKTPRVIIGLVLGIAANVCAIPMAWDLNSYAMRQWWNWYWFGSPIVVALAHVVTYFICARGDRAQERAPGGTS